jgi:methylenetetrahydrofolate--tRNA-(uracil-5-)-methyltransferase
MEDRGGVLYNIVGFQTKLTWPEQKRIFRMIPGLAKAEFARYGSVHRNTFLNAPALLSPTLQLRSDPRIFFAGQITGVEGYVESVSMGLLAGINAARFASGSGSSRRRRKRPSGPFSTTSRTRTGRPFSR